MDSWGSPEDSSGPLGSLGGALGVPEGSLGVQLDLKFCTPFQHFCSGVGVSCEASIQLPVSFYRCLERNAYSTFAFLQSSDCFRGVVLAKDAAPRTSSTHSDGEELKENRVVRPKK